MQPRPARSVTWHPEALSDLVALDTLEPSVADAALAAVHDVAYRHKKGKALGVRHVTGDLTGLFRIKFDVPGRHPERFRLVYQQPDEQSVIVWTLGERSAHAVYLQATDRPLPDIDDQAH